MLEKENLNEAEKPQLNIGAVSGSTDILGKYLAERLIKKVEQYEQNRKYLELGISTDTSDKVWRLDKMQNLLIEINCIKAMLKDVRYYCH
jgi:hypothetical protein